MRFIPVLAATALMIGTVAAQPKFIEKVTKKGDELCIPYEKYQLPNGLIILLHEDHSDPIVHVDVTYHVGSAREQEGRSGFAHFFEHMMFQGSDHVRDDEHFKIVTESGGTLNGTTNTDRTNYYETLPSNQLEIGLWLEADRMGFLLDSVTQRKFEVQRATVKNERGQNYDNKPYGLVFEKIGEALYPGGHPYSWTTIGYIEDLNRVDVNDLKKFFLRWYGPNNATLTVAGDIKIAETLKLIEKYYGPIPRGPEVKAQQTNRIALDKNRYISYEDNIRFPMVAYAFPTLPAYTKDDVALDALSDVLSGYKSSLFYQNFEKSEQAISANAFNVTRELDGVFMFQIRAYPGAPLSKVDSLLKVTLAEFEKRGVTDEDIKRFINTSEVNFVNSIGSASGKASQLAAYQTFTGDANYIKKDLERYSSLTKEDVMRVYNMYIKGKNAVILSVVPKGKPELVAHANNYSMPARNIQNESAEYKNLAYNKAKDTFDRSIKPASGPSPTIIVPEYWTEKLANNLTMIGTRNSEVPSVTINLYIEAGHRFERKDKAGIASLTTNMLNESTLKHTAEELNDELSKLGSTISFTAGEKDILMSITSLTKNIDATLKLAEEMLMQPKFDSKEFELSKKQTLEAIANQSTQPVVIANNVYNKLLYGNDHIMAVPTIGIAPTVEKITLDDLKKYYADNFVPSVSQLVIVGDLSKEQALAKLSYLNKWADKKVVRTAETTTPAIDKTRIYFVNKDKAPQSEIRIGYMAIPYDATGEFYRSQIANYVLGGAFNSHINMNLREEKGWSYGARSGFDGSKFSGPFTARAGVKGNASDSAVVEFMKEMKTYANSGITPAELEFTKKSIGQRDALAYETAGQKAGFLRRIVEYKLEKTFVDKQSEILKNISKAEIDAIAKKNLPYDKMIITVVGDKANLFERMQKLGYEVIELDSDGKPVAATPGKVEVPSQEIMNKVKTK